MSLRMLTACVPSLGFPLIRCASFLVYKIEVSPLGKAMCLPIIVLVVVLHPFGRAFFEVAAVVLNSTIEATVVLMYEGYLVVHGSGRSSIVVAVVGVADLLGLRNSALSPWRSNGLATGAFHCCCCCAFWVRKFDRAYFSLLKLIFSRQLRHVSNYCGILLEVVRVWSKQGSTVVEPRAKHTYNTMAITSNCTWHLSAGWVTFGAHNIITPTQRAYPIVCLGKRVWHSSEAPPDPQALFSLFGHRVSEHHKNEQRGTPLVLTPQRLPPPLLKKPIICG